MAELIPWRAVLAPLGEPAPDVVPISRNLRMTAFAPLPLFLDPNRLIGRVDMASVDAAQGVLVAAGHVDPSIVMEGDRLVVDAMRAGELVPTLAVDTVTIEAGEVTTCRVMYVLAQPAELSLWPGRVSFDLQG